MEDFVCSLDYTFSVLHFCNVGKNRLVSTHLSRTMKHQYTKEQLQEVIAQSSSIRQALQHLGISARGGNYQVIRKAVQQWGLDISHFTGQAHNRGKRLKPKRDVEDYLNNVAPIGSDRLRKRLLKDGILQPVCASCNNHMWLDLPIPLELDHINGNCNDNSLQNIRLLCPNCHALTSNYRGKNKGAYS